MSLLSYVLVQIFKKDLHYHCQWIKLPYLPKFGPSRIIFGDFDILHPPFFQAVKYKSKILENWLKYKLNIEWKVEIKEAIAF